MSEKAKILQKILKNSRENESENQEKIIDFEKLILQQKTRAMLENYLENPSQSLLIFGENGVGLKTVAQSLAKKIAGGNRILIAPKTHDNQKTKNINLDDIRALHKINAGKRHENFVILIDEAEKMTRDAPQAFLKLLEEPSGGIFYILTSHAPENLPATILSRIESAEIFPVDAREILSKNPEKFDAKKSAQIEFLARDLPAEMTRLLNDKKYFAKEAENIELAKKFLAGSFAEKLKIVAPIMARDDAQKFAHAIAKLVKFLSEKNLANVAKKSTRQNIDVLNQVLENLAANGHAKTQLTFLAANWAEEEISRQKAQKNQAAGEKLNSNQGGENV